MILDETRQITREHAGILGHPDVHQFWTLATGRFKEQPHLEAVLKDEIRRLWPELFPSDQEIIRGPGMAIIPPDEQADSPLAAKARYLLQTGFLSDVMAIQIACLLITEEQSSTDLRTSQITTALRLAGYKIPNPSTLVRSLAERANPVIEVLDQRVGGRQELLFRLIPTAITDLKARILTDTAHDAA